MSRTPVSHITDPSARTPEVEPAVERTQRLDLEFDSAFGLKRGPVVVLGHTGLLGQALMHVAAGRGLKTYGISRRSVPGLSLARVPDLAPFLDPLAPGLVINAAAITDLAVNECEPAEAMDLHARLPGLIAQWARQRGKPWVQISTDHYWNDTKNRRHAEDALVHPPNVYARTKHEGEMLALADPGALVLRTNIVGFRGRSGEPTFVEWALGALERAAAGGEPVKAYTDVWASSIEVHQLAEALFDLVDKGATGLLNVASRESVSKADFLTALADAAGYTRKHLVPTRRPKQGRPRRANAMGLEVARAEALLGRALPTLAEVITAIVEHPAMPKPTLTTRTIDVELA
jgi:dTDP-4-dehydrorhamnose reductase